jgi:MFS family permease
MLLDISPLRKYKNYRYLFIGQLISIFGSMIAYVALPFQIYQLTHSTLAVGMIGLIELVPLLCTSFIGGMLADGMNRKRIIIVSEALILIMIAVLAINASLAFPKTWIIYAVAGIISALHGLHRPALDAFGLNLVDKADIHAYGTLNGFKSVIGTIAGPAIGGLCIATFGLVTTYLIDMATFLISILALWRIQHTQTTKLHENPISFQRIKEGWRYALARQELFGTYIIDFAAMVFSMPNALFPAMAEGFGKPKLIGFFYAAPAVGALVVSLLSAWTKKIYRHGWAVIIAASCWGLAITGFGFVSNVWLAMGMLALAGGADAISGIFRAVIWNQNIPDHLRGRLAGIEMISYTSGPLLGNTQAGILATAIGTNNAIMLGGVLCLGAIGICARYLPKFRAYDASIHKEKS